MIGKINQSANVPSRPRLQTRESECVKRVDAPVCALGPDAWSPWCACVRVGFRVRVCMCVRVCARVRVGAGAREGIESAAPPERAGQRPAIAKRAQRLKAKSWDALSAERQSLGHEQKRRSSYPEPSPVPRPHPRGGGGASATPPHISLAHISLAS
eukprot:4050148-Pleurochrysis_carterae.AAC.1